MGLKCQACGAEFEDRWQLKEDPTVSAGGAVCPQCEHPFQQYSVA